MVHRECPRCEKCVHRTLEYGKYVHKFVASCNARECEYERKDEKSSKGGIPNKER